MKGQLHAACSEVAAPPHVHISTNKLVNSASVSGAFSLGAIFLCMQIVIGQIRLKSLEMLESVARMEL